MGGVRGGVFAVKGEVVVGEGCGFVLFTDEPGGGGGDVGVGGEVDEAAARLVVVVKEIEI